jgi:hypothetical protein
LDAQPGRLRLSIARRRAAFSDSYTFAQCDIDADANTHGHGHANGDTFSNTVCNPYSDADGYSDA